MVKRLLLLAGTKEAREMAHKFSKNLNIEILASLAGATKNPTKLPVKTRIGGFGGINGLISFIHDNRISFVLDATHPFSEQMKCHVHIAAKESEIRSLH